jgi:transposase
MKHCKLLSIDLAKTVFQLCSMDNNNHVIFNKKVSRKKLLESVLQSHPKTIVMEACYSAHYWGRLFESHGFQVNLIPAQHVKPFVKGNKNDHNDALAICEASLRPSLHFVPVKSIEQQDIQALHRIRQRKLRDRTALVNQIRGLLSEYGIIFNTGYRTMPTQIALLIEDMSSELSFPMRDMLHTLIEELTVTKEQIKKTEKQIENLAQQQEHHEKLMKIPGVGLLTASAMIAQVGDAKQFSNARGMAAWLGLTPKHHASGHKITNQGISKRGDCYLRTLLIQGGRSVLCQYKDQNEPLKQFAIKIKERRGINIASVAVAHKIARIIWVVLTKNQNYNPNHILTQK